VLSKARGIGRSGSILFVILVISIVVAACGSSAGILSTVGGAVSGGQSGGQPVGAAATSAPAVPAAGNGGSEGEDPDSLAGQTDLQIIKTGSMLLQVGDIDAALATATQQITSMGGYISGSERSGDEESDQAALTFRIPVARWDDALASLRGLATKVLDERSTTEDVTTQVVDLGARITNLQATERALQGIMDRATEIKDVLAVQAELASVRGEIERMAAEKAHLEGQAAYSTLTLTLSLKPDPVLASTSQFDPRTEVDQASASLVGFLQSLATAGIWFGIVWLPILVTLAIVVGIGAFVVRRIRRGDTGNVPVAPTG